MVDGPKFEPGGGGGPTRTVDAGEIQDAFRDAARTGFAALVGALRGFAGEAEKARLAEKVGRARRRLGRAHRGAEPPHKAVWQGVGRLPASVPPAAEIERHEP